MRNYYLDRVLATQKVLEKKIAASVRRFSKAKDEAALTTLWQEALASGKVPGALWALSTHHKAGEQVLYRAYEDVHMLSHQIGAGQRADLKELAETRAELHSLRCLHEQATRRAQQQGEEKERRIRALETRLSQTAGFQAKLSAMQSRLFNAWANPAYCCAAPESPPSPRRL